MYLKDYQFNDYYHKYFIFEVDALTDQLKDQIDVHEDDCFALCSSYIREDGVIGFQVLAIGPSLENCKRELNKNAILGVFEIEDVLECPVTMIEPTLRMRQKNERLLAEEANYTDDDLYFLRKDQRLDTTRDLHRPDFVKVGILEDHYLYQYYMKTTEIDAPFIVGKLKYVPEKDTRVKNNERVKALPIFLFGEYHLLAVFIGDKISKEEEDKVMRTIQEDIEEELGITYKTLKN